MKKRILLIIKLIVGICLLAIVIRSVDFQQLSSRITSINYYLLFMVWLLFIFDRVLMAFKWNLLLYGFGIFLPLWQSVKLYYIGTLLGTFTPGNIGADAYRVVALSDFKKNKIVASTVLLERLTGYSVLAAFAAFLLPFSAKILGIDFKMHMGAVALFVCILGATLLLLFFPFEAFKLFFRIKTLQRFQVFKRINESLDVYMKNPPITKKRLLSFVLLSMLEVVVIIYMNYLASHALHLEVSFFFYLMTLPILYILIRLPITVQGIGLQEGLWVYVLTLAGFSAADGISLSLLLRVMEILSVFLPAGVLLLSGELKIKATI